jgi:uncharacterized membrane protein
MKMSNLIASAIISAVALPAISQAAPAPVPTYTSEKCFGIAARGSNDCATATHGCAGTSTKAKDAASWVYVPAGTCKKIEGGSLTAKS